MGTVKRQSYSKEFKVNAVKMMLQGGKRSSEVARDLGIKENMLYLWKRKFLKDKQESHSRVKVISKTGMHIYV